MNKGWRWMGVAMAVASGSVVMVACGQKNEGDAKPGAAKAAGAAVPVTTVVAEQGPFDVVLDATGTLTPVAMVDIRPQMSGVIRQVHVKEGQMVQAGQLLFTLDAQADQANLAKMQAQLAKDQALLADAERQLKRAEDLVARNFLSVGAADTARTNRDSLLATVAADKAAMEAAQVPVSNSQVRAATSGRLGAVPVFLGSAVKVNDTSLGTIVQTDSMDVAFSVPQDKLPALLERMKTQAPEVQVHLPQVGKPVTGQLSFVDNTVDAATGTVKVKARLKNTGGQLWPGLMVQVKLKAQHLDDAVLVPAQAVLQSPKGTAVFAVREGKAVIQRVKVIASQNDVAAVEGLQAGEKVVVDGRQNLRPDAAVAEIAPKSDKDNADKAGKGNKPEKSGKAEKTEKTDAAAKVAESDKPAAAAKP
jgi:RND family efflux transporter MFP subunit